MARILCIDDDAGGLSLKAAILERADYAVTTASTVETAIAKLKTIRFDAVVTDWKLGEDCGRSVVQAVKLHSKAPVIVVTGYSDEAFQAAEPRADMYLEKPINPQELVAVLKSLLQARN